MATGLYRTNDGWVEVAYGGNTTFAISRKRYEEKGYQPSFDSLPAKQDVGGNTEKPRQSYDQ